jgi:hypothetical protein
MPADAGRRKDASIADAFHGEAPKQVRAQPEGLAQSARGQTRFIHQPDRPSPKSHDFPYLHYLID